MPGAFLVFGSPAGNGNDGTGQFGPGFTGPVGAFPHDVTTGAVDGDADLDLLVTNWQGRTVSVRSNDGTGLYTVRCGAGARKLLVD